MYTHSAQMSNVFTILCKASNKIFIAKVYEEFRNTIEIIIKNFIFSKNFFSTRLQIYINHLFPVSL